MRLRVPSAGWTNKAHPLVAVAVVAADAHGRRYYLDTLVRGPGGSAWVRTAWIVKTGEDFPRLTSCCVL
jgi:hypothetical protein